MHSIINHSSLDECYGSSQVEHTCCAGAWHVSVGGYCDSCGMLMAAAAKQMWKDSSVGPHQQSNTGSEV